MHAEALVESRRLGLRLLRGLGLLRARQHNRVINHPAKGPAPPGSILFSMPVCVHATKKKKNEEKQEKEQGTSHLAAVRELRPDLAGWYTGENSGGVPPRSLYVELVVGALRKCGSRAACGGGGGARAQPVRKSSLSTEQILPQSTRHISRGKSHTVDATPAGKRPSTRAVP